MMITWVVQTPISLLLGRVHRRPPALPGPTRGLVLPAAAAVVGRGRDRVQGPARPQLRSRRRPAPADPRPGLARQPRPGCTRVVFVIAWQFIPFHTLLYQGGVRQIPASMYEAAQIDGAGRVRQFFSITIPQLRYTIITSSTLMLVGSLTYFDLIFVLTGGGPGDATRILPLRHVHHRLPGQPDGRSQRHRVDPRGLRPRSDLWHPAARWP